MTLLIDSGDRPVESVLHPTDLSEASLAAFHHALAIGVRNAARLTLLHAVGQRSTDSWVDFPSVRGTLSRWRAAGHLDDLEAQVKRSSVRKAEVTIRDPVAACLAHLRKHEVDLIVLATEGRGGLSRLVRASRAEKLARESKLPALFVPRGVRPFVDGETGEVRLGRILVPVAESTDPKPAMLFAVRVAALLDDPSLEITLLHVSDRGEAIATEAPELPFCRWNVLTRPGDPAEQILAVADEIRADTICMSTSWNRPGLGRSDSGVTERVLREAPCPLAAVPA
jgi:nucleotide-binding universal stress UspA family protein